VSRRAQVSRHCESLYRNIAEHAQNEHGYSHCDRATCLSRRSSRDRSGREELLGRGDMSPAPVDSDSDGKMRAGSAAIDRAKRSLALL
jgi:hypothetical protein